MFAKCSRLPSEIRTRATLNWHIVDGHSLRERKLTLTLRLPWKLIRQTDQITNVCRRARSVPAAALGRRAIHLASAESRARTESAHELAPATGTSHKSRALCVRPELEQGQPDRRSAGNTMANCPTPVPLAVARARRPGCLQACATGMW